MPEQANTPEWEQDLAERQAGFQAGLQSLLGKYEMGLLPVPNIQPDGTISAKINIFSVRKDPTQKTPEAAPEVEVPNQLSE